LCRDTRKPKIPLGIEVGGRPDVDQQVLTGKSVKTISGCGFARSKSTLDDVDAG
jgi:hypothetical protein